MNDTPETAVADPFNMEPQKAGFESMSHDNGFRYWWGSELATLLGYDGLNSFRKAIERAMVTLTSLNVPIFDNIIQEPRTVAGKSMVDYKLSRFACYLAAMNGDPKKPQVAKAQAYFVMWAEACRLSLERADGVERVGIRFTWSILVGWLTTFGGVSRRRVLASERLRSLQFVFLLLDDMRDRQPNPSRSQHRKIALGFARRLRPGEAGINYRQLTAPVAGRER